MLLKDFLNEGVARLESLYPTKEARNIMLMLCESRIGTKVTPISWNLNIR